MPNQGGCQCGRIRYHTTGPIQATNVCFCRMCQRASGGPFMAFIRVAADTLTWSTEPETFASSNVVERGFCNACGTPLTYRWLGGPNINLTLNSLDDPASAPPPQTSYTTAAKAAWLSHLDSLHPDDDDPASDPGFISNQTP